jgi:hypothetical protein
MNKKSKLFFIARRLQRKRDAASGFKKGDRIIYENPNSEYNGKLGVFNKVREDGKYKIIFNDGIKFAATKHYVKPIKKDPQRLKHAKDDPYGEENWEN